MLWTTFSRSKEAVLLSSDLNCSRLTGIFYRSAMAFCLSRIAVGSNNGDAVHRRNSLRPYDVMQLSSKSKRLHSFYFFICSLFLFLFPKWITSSYRRVCASNINRLVLETPVFLWNSSEKFSSSSSALISVLKIEREQSSNTYSNKRNLLRCAHIYCIAFLTK